MGIDTKVGSVPGVQRPDPLNQLKQKAQEMEGVFLNTFVSEMFKSLEADSMFGGGHAEETWRGMLAEEYANEMARSGGIGIADQLVASLLETQGLPQQPQTPLATAIGAYRK